MNESPALLRRTTLIRLTTSLLHRERIIFSR